MASWGFNLLTFQIITNLLISIFMFANGWRYETAGGMRWLGLEVENFKNR